MPLSVASSHPTALLDVNTKYAEEWYESQVKEKTLNFSITDMRDAEAYAYQRHNEKHESDRDTQPDSNYLFYWAEMHKQLELMETNYGMTVSFVFLPPDDHSGISIKLTLAQNGNGAPSNMNGTGKDKTDLVTEQSVGEQSHQG